MCPAKLSPARRCKSSRGNCQETALIPLRAVDAVIDFMGEDPGWGERPLREGHVIYSSKAPRDPKGYASAQDEAGKRKAYCFCPLVRNHLDGGMPVTFCHCGAGWYRQQWEGAIGKPVRIKVVKSVLEGDDVCQLAIHLPVDLSREADERQRRIV